MRQSTFTETQIVSILKEADAGRPVNEIWRSYSISSATYYKWKAKYGGGGGVGHQTAQGAGAREQQAEASLCRHGAGECGAEGCPRNKTRTPAERREVATHLVTQGGLPVQRACQAVGLGRAMYYRPVVNWAQRDAPVIEALTTLGATTPRWGFWTYVDQLRCTGHRWNHTRVWRVYCQLRLNLPRRTKQRLLTSPAQPLVVLPQPNAIWALDFMSDTLYGGRRFRTFNMLDAGVREVLAIEVDTSLPVERVLRVLDQVTAWRGQPQAIRLDNGPECLADRVASWCADRGIALRSIQPGQPNQTAFIERFNRTYQTEVLDASVFESLDQVREISAQWMPEYNEERPHDALARVPSATYRAQITARSSPLEVSP